MARLRPLTRLRPADADRLREVPLTYPEVGASLAADLPAVYHHLERSARVGGPDELDTLAGRLLALEVQRGSGLRVATSTPSVEERTVVLMRLGVGPLALRVPCRVVAVVDEPERRGFAYGTLPGHPETGEEAFVLERRPDGVHLVVRAFSRPATTLVRLAGPVAGLAQRVATERYLRALTR